MMEFFIRTIRSGRCAANRQYAAKVSVLRGDCLSIYRDNRPRWSLRGRLETICFLNVIGWIAVWPRRHAEPPQLLNV
ncbi:hypothetical protein FIBSPDRAFT_200328 [Athelia psychrophila]|uniref:Uncharacterized protein n=1 Tax=Athelia psychrophila TaxID=1759441 RepID=A0A165ZJK2_9AGAM|nr:hypothetical protein FIBSPDRAFT_200328 [Fibularhizoctonia sp. CBS 109695]